MPDPYPTPSERHNVVIVGGGTAGITVAARLRRAGVSGVAVIEPSDTHWYQPLWTLVGGGEARIEETAKPQASVLPQGVAWLRDSAIAIDPRARTVTTAGGKQVGYQYLVMAPGIQLDWGRVPGLAESLGDGVASNYRPDLAPKTWELIRGMRGGTAVFMQPGGPIKCAGAPQKIAYLAADYWRKKGLLDKIRVVLVLPTPGMFGVPFYAAVLEQVARRYGIEVRFQSEVAEIDAAGREAVVVDNAAGSKERIRYDMMHVVPPQSAPDWVKESPLADPESPFGYIKVDKHTLQSPDFPEIFALGDAANLPTSKTGAAVRKQAPTVVGNLLSAMAGRPVSKRYNGYTSCPLVTARHRMLLAEFDYDLNVTPTVPLINTGKERFDMWVLKRWGLPLLYWQGMLKGRA